MTDTIIFIKAIKKARANGYDFDYVSGLAIEPIIFSHGFAKAFWGEFRILETTKYLLSGIEVEKQKVWEYHLQQMVLKKNPIKYLEKFL